MLKPGKIKRIIYVLLFTTSVLQSQSKDIDFSKFIGEKAEITIQKEYSFSSLYDYKINSQNFDSIVTKPYNKEIPENLIILKYLSKINTNKKDIVIFFVNLTYKLSINIQDKRHVFIKYRTKEKEKRDDYQVLIAIKENNIWEENLAKTKEVNLVKSILLNSSVNLLYKFYNKKDNPKNPEINKLKPLTKNGDLLDIEKLAKILNENKALLAKYLDR